MSRKAKSATRLGASPEQRQANKKADAEYLQAYSAAEYPRPALTVDIVVLTVLEGALQVLLIRRGIPPFEGTWALPGGFVHIETNAPGDPDGFVGEDVDEAAARELSEETGLGPDGVRLEQVRAFGRPDRDPRGRVITIGYCALVRPELAAEVKAGTDAAYAAFVPVAEVIRPSRGPHGAGDDGHERLAFDHDEILACTLEHVRRRLDRSHLALCLVPAVFTSSELRRVFELTLGEPLNAGNFHRKLDRLLELGIIEEAEGRRVTGKRPARVFRSTAKAL